MEKHPFPNIRTPEKKSPLTGVPTQIKSQPYSATFFRSTYYRSMIIAERGKPKLKEHLIRRKFVERVLPHRLGDWFMGVVRAELVVSFVRPYPKDGHRRGA
jgi:hypothetical protein